MTPREEFAALEALDNVPADVRRAGLNIIAAARNKVPACRADLETVRAHAARRQRVNRWGKHA